MRRLLVLCAALLAAAPAQAAVFTVNSTVDAVDATPYDGVCADEVGACTLRAAITEVNRPYGTEDILLPAGRYVLKLGQLVVDDYSWPYEVMRLRGSGAAATIIDAAGSSNVIYALTPLELEGVTITGGALAGGVVALSSLSIRDSVIAGNAADSGGGIFTVGNSVYSLLLDRVTVSHNRANQGGALAILGAWSVRHFTIVNSTISNNTTEEGATIEIVGAEGVIADSTVADNRRGSHASATLSAILPSQYAGPVVLFGSIVANPELDANCGPAITSGGYNVANDDSCNLTDPTDLPNTDPLLGPLLNHGGPTWTHALLPGSPAKNAIPVADCTYDNDGDPGTPDVPLVTDQRGVARPQGAGCDIGAFEQVVCGLGAELAFLLPPLLWLRQRRRAARA